MIHVASSGSPLHLFTSLTCSPWSMLNITWKDACVRACVHVCFSVCVCARVRVSVRACMCVCRASVFPNMLPVPFNNNFPLKCHLPNSVAPSRLVYMSLCACMCVGTDSIYLTQDTILLLTHYHSYRMVTFYHLGFLKVPQFNWKKIESEAERKHPKRL